jgi:hypothetical protein
LERLRDLLLQQAAQRRLPSLADNCPMVVLEAAAAGGPVAAAKSGGLPDLIEPEETRLLFDPADSDSISGAVAKLLINRDYAEGLAIEAGMQARERCHAQTAARRHVAIYSEIASSRQHATLTLTRETRAARFDSQAAAFERAGRPRCPSSRGRVYLGLFMPIRVAVLDLLPSNYS